MQAVISSSRRHPRRLGIVLGAMVVLVAVVLAAALRHPGTAGAATALSCGQTVTASITLSNDLTCEVGSAIVVGKAGITINLGGHTLTGAGTATGVGVENGNVDQPGFSNVTITNGAITAFEAGVLSSGTGAKINKLRVFHTRRGIEVAEKSSIAGNTVWDALIGIRVVGNATGTIVSSNVVNESTLYGINLAAGGTVSANRVSNNHVGIIVGTEEANTVLNNVATGNDTNGIQSLSSHSTVSGNVANFNDRYGIDADGGSAQDGKNTAKGNTNPRQCRNVVCL